MLGNSSSSTSQKTLLIPTPTTRSQWTENHHKQQNHIGDDHKDILMASAAVTVRPMDQIQKLQQQQQQPQPQPQQPLKCPRCDSSNTKFCYYNNYSLSQPRHFCKACKRYWTRGGTLRNVPVGGGCRKNKRVRRPSSSSSLDSPAHIDGSAASNRADPLFYGLARNANSEISLPFPSFINSHALSAHDLHPQLSALGLGFTSTPSLTSQISDSLLSGYGMFGSSSSSSGLTLASLGASNNELQQQRFMNGNAENNHHFQGFVPFQGNICDTAKDAHVEGSNRIEWNNTGGPKTCQNGHQMESSPSLYWSSNAATMGGGWSDMASMGSSVTSLI